MHFIGYVIGEDIDSVLAPFDENLEVESYKFYEDDVEVYAMYRHYLYDELKSSYNVDVENKYPEHKIWSQKKSFEETLELVGQILKEHGDNRSIAEFIGYDSIESLVEAKGEDWSGCKWGKDENGWYRWSTYNPKSQWDWYEVGGRWGGFFQLKEGTTPVYNTEFSWTFSDERKDDVMTNHKADSAYRKDIVDFENQYPYYVVIDGDWLSKYDFEKKNEYIGDDGEKHYDFEKANEEWKEFLKNEVYPNIGDDDIVTAVDCHI